MGRTLSEDIGERSEAVGCWHSTDEGSEQRGKRSGGATGGKGSSQGEPDSQSTCWAQYQISVYQAAVKRVRVCESRDDCLSRLASLAKAGAGCISVQVRICAGGTGKPVFLPRRAPG